MGGDLSASAAECLQLEEGWGWGGTEGTEGEKGGGIGGGGRKGGRGGERDHRRRTGRRSHTTDKQPFPFRSVSWRNR